MSTFVQRHVIYCVPLITWMSPKRNVATTIDQNIEGLILGKAYEALMDQYEREPGWRNGCLTEVGGSGSPNIGLSSHL